MRVCIEDMMVGVTIHVGGLCFVLFQNLDTLTK